MQKEQNCLVLILSNCQGVLRVLEVWGVWGKKPNPKALYHSLESANCVIIANTMRIVALVF